MATVFERYAAALERLQGDPGRVRYCQTQRQAASAYVWGWQDAGGGERDTQVATDFGYVYGELCALYAAELLHYRQNIADAWKRYRATGEAMDGEQLLKVSS